MYTKLQLLQASRVSRFYESNESKSLSEYIKIIGKYISLCNSFAVVVLSSYLVRTFLGTTGISHVPRCHGNQS